ncbi:gamma-glutamyltransferase [Oceanobacillus sp. CAU 1775]
MSIDEIIRNQKPTGQSARNKTVSGKKGMVSCAVKEASIVGEEVLKDGGNAIDAVVAMQLALSAVEGMNTGLGGSGYMIYYDKESNETKVFNGNSRAPAAVTPKLFYDENDELMEFDDRTTSPLAVGVPGLIKLLELAHGTHGSMSLERLIDPAIRLAEEEFRVNELWDRTLQLFSDRLGDEAKKFYVPNGQALKEGDYVRQPDLAKTLKVIREEGFSSFYTGEIADAIVDTVKNLGGIMEKDDLIGYEAKTEPAFWGSYKDYDLAYPAPPNGGGIALSVLLKLFEKTNVSQYDIHSWEKYHVIAESIRIALADQQTYIGDPEIISIPNEAMTCDEYIEERMKLIDFSKLHEEIKEGNPWKHDERKANYTPHMDVSKHGMDTTHLTAVDQWGNIAACTTSIERIFGSGIMVPGFGFMLNNDLTDFNPEPGTANEPNGNKYVLSSKSPTIVFDNGKPFFTLGSPGASTIVGSVAQVLLHVLDYKMDLGEAIAEPRIFNDPKRTMEWEDGINDEAMKKLKDLGYKLDRSFKNETADSRISDIKAILIDHENGMLYGSSDSPRPSRTIGVNETS